MTKLTAQQRLLRTVALKIVRPYIRHELPGWGRFYRAFVGSYLADPRWQGMPERWIRGKLHGYEMKLDISRWSNRSTYFLGRFYDLPTQIITTALLRRGGTFVDIGANEGMISLIAAAAVGEEGRVISFEPNPTPRAFLEAAIERNGITQIDVRPMGLGASDETLQLTIPNKNTGEGSFGRLGYDCEDTTQIACAVRVADDQLRDLRPDLIKIDVEGFEPYVLDGLTRTLRASCAPVVMEVVSTHLANAGSSVSALAERMRALGYRPLRTGLGRKGLRHVVTLTATNLTNDFRGDVLWLHDTDTISITRLSSEIMLS